MSIPYISFINILKNAKQILSNPLPFHKKNFKKHGDTFGAKLGFGNSIIFTKDTGLITHILKTNHRNYHKSPIQSKQLAKYIGNGLLTSNGDYWLQQRRLIQPAFYKKKLEGVREIINAVVKEEIDNIPLNKTINIRPIMSNLAFKVVGKSLFNYSEDELSIERLQKITEEVQVAVIKEIRQNYKYWWFVLNGHIAKTKKLAEESRSILRSLIEKRQASTENHDDLLDLLLHSKYEDGSAMTMDQLIDEILILFVAGHETTANALSFGVMLLSKNNDVQQQLFNEVAAIDFSKLSIMDSFKTCTYTKQCIDETMRLYPPAYFSDRIAIEDDVFDGNTYKKGTTILTSFYELHRNKSIWETPEKYDPNRFGSILTKEQLSNYFPFGAGPRMCVGSNFALYEMMIIIGTLTQRYVINSEFSNIEIKPLITLQPKNAWVSFKKR